MTVTIKAGRPDQLEGAYIGGRFGWQRYYWIRGVYAYCDKVLISADSIDELDEEIERQLRAKDVADRLRGYGGMADAPA